MQVDQKERVENEMPQEKERRLQCLQENRMEPSLESWAGKPCIAAHRRVRNITYDNLQDSTGKILWTP